MPSSVILDVAIGVAFVYLFFSLICSVFNEGIASLFALRAKNLVAGVSSLFSESQTANGKHFVQEIYQHGLVRGLFKDPPNPQEPPDALGLAKKWYKTKVNLPSYIPSRTFATALLDILAPSDGKTPRALAEVRKGIDALPESPAKEALVSLAASTGYQLSEFQTKVESWYNDSMERAAGWYKRRTQKILLLLGVLVAVGMNVDSIQIALNLWNNPVARQAAIDVGQKFVEKNPIQASDKTDAVKKITDEADTLAKMGQSLPVPFGWRSEMQANGACPDEACFYHPLSTMFWPQKLVGWLITALALSLGAPFWFDTLNKFMMVRSTLKSKGDKEKSS